MIKIQSANLNGGAAANITFTSIPSTYTDLCLVFSVRSAVAGNLDQVWMQFNGDTSSNYAFSWTVGTGSADSSNGGTSATQIVAGYIPGSTATASTFTSSSVYIPNYAGSVAKSANMEHVFESTTTAVTGIVGFSTGYWSGTSAINSIKLFTQSGSNLAQYCTATLYGVLKGTDGTTTTSVA